VQIFDSQGKLLDIWTGIPRPCGLCVDAAGTVYVSELCMRLSIFAGDGRLLARWGNEGGKDKSKALFLAPHNVAVDSLGDLYVAEVSLTYHGVDKGTNAVLKFARR
jgi:sugar lactone lactonase YvrE